MNASRHFSSNSSASSVNPHQSRSKSNNIQNNISPSDEEKLQRQQRFQRETTRDFQLVSRQLGMDEEIEPERDLRRFQVQETFHDDYILPKRMQLMSNPDDEVSRTLMVDYRKLREGLVSSQRMDGFTAMVYESSCEVAIVTGDWPEFLRGAQHLVKTLYPTLGKLGMGKYLNKSCIYVKYLLLYLMCSQGEGGWSQVTRIHRELPKTIRKDVQVLYAMQVLKCFMHMNYWQLYRIWCKADGMEKRLLTLALPNHRIKLLPILKRAYLKLPRDYLLQVLCLEQDESLEPFLEKLCPANSLKDTTCSTSSTINFR